MAATRLPRPWDSPGKNTGVGCHFLLQCMKVKMKVKSLSRVRLLATPWTEAHQAPPSMGFSRQEYWSGVINIAWNKHCQLFYLYLYFHVMCHQYGYIFVFNKSSKGVYGRPTLKHYVNYLLEIMRRRQWHPTPVLLPGKSHGGRSLVGCSPWGR